MKAFWASVALLASLGLGACGREQAESPEAQSPPQASPVTIFALSDEVPDWIKPEWPALAEKLAKEMSARHGGLTGPVVYELFWEEGQQAGQLSLAGDTRRGSMRITLAGEGWLVPSDRARSIWQQNLAHESVHLWQREAHDDVGEVVWLHEGLAEDWSDRLLVAVGAWSQDQAATLRDTRERACGLVLAEGRLIEKIHAQDRQALYQCGSVMAAAIQTYGQADSAGSMSDFTALLGADASKAQTGEFMRGLDESGNFERSLSLFLVQDYSLANHQEILARLKAGNL
jgi:hypothetical protein